VRCVRRDICSRISGPGGKFVAEASERLLDAGAAINWLLGLNLFA
jgi:hypothetical protein